MLITKLRLHVSVLALSAMSASLVVIPGTALAQTAEPAQQRFHFDIAAGPLLQALSRYSEITGVQLVYPSSVAQGLSSPGLSGDYTAREALARLTAGTGLVPRMVSATSATLEAPVSVDGARTLGSVNVEGQQSSGFAPVNGFGAGAGANGSSDPTATEGTGSFTTNGASVASKTPQSLKDTTQSVSVITQERIVQQNLTDLASAFQNLTGVTLAQTSGVQSNYVSRGFTIGTYQIDGGAPQAFSLGASQTSNQNLAEFDNVQIIRGSDALYGGAGQPGGVVSLNRKRPLDHNQLNVDLNIGSWNNYRGTVDLTGPIALNGALKARLVIEGQDRDYFYNVAHTSTAFVYGVLEGDIGSKTVVRVGGSYESQNNHGYNASGLPRYTDGGDLGLPRSTCLCATWGNWDFRTSEVFGVLEHQFSDAWRLKVNATRTDRSSDLIQPSFTAAINRGAATGAGDRLSRIYNQPGLDDTQFSIDGNVAGSFSLIGQKQSLLLGMDYTHSASMVNVGSSRLNVPIPNIYTFNPSILNPEPPLPAITTRSNILQQQYGIYGNLDLQPVHSFHVTGGLRLSYFTYTQANNGVVASLGGSFSSTWVPTPFASVRFDVTKSVALYASYADIYQSQSGDLDLTGNPLPPVKGVTYEGGVKGVFRGGKLNASVSYYNTKEQNQAIFDIAHIGACAIGFICYLSTGDYFSQGVDAEVTGEVLPGWQLQAGYTFNHNKYGDAYAARSQFGSFQTQQPAHQVKLWTAYTLPGARRAWTVGGGLRLESARYTTGSVCSIEVNPTTGACAGTFVPFNYTQDLYVVGDVRVAYQVNRHWQAALNVTNISDTRYFSTAGSSNSGNFYGEPRAFLLSVHATY